MANEVKVITEPVNLALLAANKWIKDSANAEGKTFYNYGPVEFAKVDDNALTIVINRKKVTTLQNAPTIHGTTNESEWTYIKAGNHPVMWFGSSLWFFGVK